MIVRNTDNSLEVISQSGTPYNITVFAGNPPANIIHGFNSTGGNCEIRVIFLPNPGQLPLTVLSEEDKNDSINRMKLSGIIIDKGFEERHPAYQDSTSMFFDLKIMKLSKDDVSVGGKMLQVGDTFKLLVTHYGGLLDSL